MDDLYPGWTGLLDVEPEVLRLLEPLSRDAVGRYRRYDWTLQEYAEEHTLSPAPLVVLEGVGAGNRAWSPWVSAMVWVETDDRTRLERGLARDGHQFRTEWLAWMADETLLFAQEQTRSRADVTIAT